MPQNQWEIKRLRLRYRLVASIAISSLRIRMGRSVLTLLTIAACCAFLMFLLITPPVSGDEKERWGLMLVLSFLVSLAGVSNTMLMSVTQRYREIGTMKCLGALDSFVLLSVLFEAGLLGVAGAIAGALAGLLFGAAVGVLQGGLDYLAGLGILRLAGSAAAVALVGLVLTTLGAAVPAWIASRMPPVEAMRGEK